MPTPAKTNKTTPNAEYQQAERLINQSISNMDAESHIEYGNTMERNSQPSKWKKWLYGLLSL